MLPVKKQDTEQENAKPSTAVAFGKVLGSIQGLQQRLGDFSYGEVSIAEAKVKMLVKQLGLLRDRLSNLVQLKLACGEIDRRLSEAPVTSYEHVNPDGLEKHPQLHAILQASQLARFQSLMKGDHASADVVALKAVNAGPSDQALVANETGTQSKAQQPQDTDKKPPREANKSARTADDDARIENIRPAAKYTSASRAHSARTTKNEPSSFTIPNESIAAIQDNQVGDQTKDWSFDLHEAVPISADTFTAPVNFEFPLDSVEDLEPVSKNVSNSKPPPVAAQSSARVTKTPPDSPKVFETKASVSAQAIPAKSAPTKPEVDLDESKALVPANRDFDQRLLADVIKNYGDFAGTANLPATLDTSTKIVPVTDSAAKPHTAEIAQPTAAERKILNVQKSGDLDRQLKKIIKDYGEYDIYERKSVISFKSGGIIAFAVLGVVLAVLYLFKAPASVPAPQTGAATQPQVAERLNSPEAAKSAATTVHGIGPDAANASSSPVTDSNQNP